MSAPDAPLHLHSALEITKLLKKYTPRGYNEDEVAAAVNVLLDLPREVQVRVGEHLMPPQPAESVEVVRVPLKSVEVFMTEDQHAELQRLSVARGKSVANLMLDTTLDRG